MRDPVGGGGSCGRRAVGQQRAMSCATATMTVVMQLSAVGDVILDGSGRIIEKGDEHRRLEILVGDAACATDAGRRRQEIHTTPVCMNEYLILGVQAIRGVAVDAGEGKAVRLRERTRESCRAWEERRAWEKSGD